MTASAAPPAPPRPTTLESLETDGAEVQKGNAPVERKLQRLFRREDACRLIKRCNDFGAGGVSVAVGELADGLFIDLNAVPKKYEGLDGTELAISESQERMAVALAPEDVEAFIVATPARRTSRPRSIATVTEEPRLQAWSGTAPPSWTSAASSWPPTARPSHTSVHVGKPEAYSHDLGRLHACREAPLPS